MKEFSRDIINFFDNDDKLKVWPFKPAKKHEVMLWFGCKFEYKMQYSEKEINEIIITNISMGDYQLIRRELIEKKILCRTANGLKYWRNDEI